MRSHGQSLVRKHKETLMQLPSNETQSPVGTVNVEVVESSKVVGVNNAEIDGASTNSRGECGGRV